MKKNPYLGGWLNALDPDPTGLNMFYLVLDQPWLTGDSWASVDVAPFLFLTTLIFACVLGTLNYISTHSNSSNIMLLP